MCEPTDVTLQMEMSTDKLRSDKYSIPDLPNTKDYHLFICYTECDSRIVRDIVTYFEAGGLKCCYNERDFPSGRKVIHSINDAIKKSMGIIIVLSEESINSNFCQHEIDLAVHTSIIEGYTIIPIKIQPCTIPETLQEITYIDAQNKETSELYILILNAFLQNVWHVEQERTNGLTRSIPLTPYEKGFLKSLSVWRVRLLVSQNERQSIKMKGFNVSSLKVSHLKFLILL
ncbi:uncharacterized protein LOC132733466 [Ruditapes philippinarum]|uniref:uncharacterized protein LOC132733466 n=1 Tax=Ruditapes philippinarum TaxID=129788 RepID=UPI00295BC0FB|nr:uncharacterized protein LOC132733466 [Ruditapes philippinarum]